MGDAIRILMLEDVATDAAIIEEELKEAGLVFQARRVIGKEDYLRELDRFSPDLILSDYNLPQYDGALALQVAKAKCPEIPFILVTGAIGEELAIAMFIRGANDYVMKGKLQRLVPAVRRTLAEAAEIKARKKAEEALRCAHDELEITVERRTAELQKEIAVRRKAEDLLRQSEEKLRLALDAAQQGTWDWNIVTDELNCSEKCKALYGIPPETPMNYDLFLSVIHPEDRERIVQAIRHALEQKTDYDVEMRGAWPDGTVHWIAAKGRGFYDGTGRAVRMSGMAWDITLRKRYEEEIRTLSNTDELTGLYNRRGFMMLAKQELKRAERTKKGLLLIYADLDGLKTINDTLGHQRGDEALVEAAGILREVLRESDIIGRIGGDEFALLVSETSTTYAGMVKTRLQRRIERHNAFAMRPYALSMCIGVSHYDPLDPISLDKLIAMADSEMYERKRSLSDGNGRNGTLQSGGPYPLAL
jgi:diguanylate cyclase (GGDEF)-like protein/PAS domain S-box-containing protein